MRQSLRITKPVLGPAGHLPNTPDGKEDYPGWKNRPSNSLSQKVIQVSQPWNVRKFTFNNLFCLYFPFYAITREIHDKNQCLMKSKRALSISAE